MMQTELSTRLNRRLRNSQRGQSILLLALGFIALAAFVGLVTDISIMFVRFSTLRQAVDAASVAAAGQVREGTDYGTVALAARQYIVLHGLQPHRVWVETCETDIAEWRVANPEVTNPSDPDFGRPISELMPETDLCSWNNPRKLVRVVAQIDSETTFLRLIGIDNFVLTASSTSETAVLDVALVLDTSASMAVETSNLHYVGMNVPAATDVQWNDSNIIPSHCRWVDPQNPASSANYSWAGCCNDPGGGAFLHQVTDAGAPNLGEWIIYTDGSYTGLDGNGLPTFAGANGVYDAGSDYLGIQVARPDGNSSDLVCQPFKQVRDAARNFIQQLDFVRGDRVGLVTYDRTASIIRPNNLADVPAMMVSEEDAVRTLNQYVKLFVNPTNELAGCIALDQARIDANSLVGREVASLDPNNIYDGLANKLRPWFSYEVMAQCTNTNIGDGILFANSILTDPTTVRRDAVWVAIILTDGAANASRYVGDAVPFGADGYSAPDAPIPYGSFGFCPWYTFCFPDDDIDNNPFRDRVWLNYEYTAAEIPDPVLRAENNDYIQGWDIYSSWNTDPWRSHLLNVLGFSESHVNKITHPNFVTMYSECQASFTRNVGGVAEWDAYIAKRSANPGHYCQDMDPKTRHFCLVWSNNPDLNGLPPENVDVNHPCAELGAYDADDYARDMADFAGLIEVAPGVPGNFIAMFSIAFGQAVRDSPSGYHLLRYISDAGDNGVIDRNLEQDWRDDGVLTYGPNAAPGAYPESFGLEDPCYQDTATANDPTAWCGQYYYAENLQQLDEVFEAIASRLFTRIAR